MLTLIRMYTSREVKTKIDESLPKSFENTSGSTNVGKPSGMAPNMATLSDGTRYDISIVTRRVSKMIGNCTKGVITKNESNTNPQIENEGRVSEKMIEKR